MEHILIRVVIEIVSWVAHLFQSDDKEAEQKANQAAQPMALPPQFQQDQLAQDQPPMSDLNDFMRRMQQMQQPQHQPPQQPPVQPQSAPPRRLVPAHETVDVEILDEPPTGRGVAMHVQQAINTRGMQERTSHMADGVRSADEQMEARLHQKFDHKVGHLRGGTEDYTVTNSNMDTGPTGRAVEGAAASAEQIGAMLRDPKTVRTAIILNEIMRPMFDRE